MVQVVLIVCGLALALSGCAHRRSAATAGTTAALRPGLEHASARAALEAAAADPDPSVRALALATLVRIESSPAGGRYGLQAAFDPSPWVQRQLIDALVPRSAEPESGALLLALATRPGVEPYVACAAALRARSGPALQAALVTRLQAGPRWARPPCALAGLRHGVPGAAAAGNAALAEGDIPLNLGFVSDLFTEDARALQPGLDAALPLVEPELAPALAALLTVWQVPTGASTLEALWAGGSAVDQVGLVDALAQLPSTPSDTALRARAGGSSGAAAEAAQLHLAARGAGGVSVVLAAAADADDRERRARALAALGGALCQANPDKRLVREAPALLRAGLRDADDRVQIAALQATGRCSAAALPASELEPLLVDPEAEGRVRAEAARALLVRVGG